MSTIKVKGCGSYRFIAFSGEVRSLPEALHEAAMMDPEIEKAVMNAATAISYTNQSKAIGEEMIDMVLNPNP